MDYGIIIDYLQSALLPILIFIALLFYTMIRGRRSITSLILGLYFALLVTLEFPYHDVVDTWLGAFISKNTAAMIVFALFTAIAAVLMDRLLFYRIDESAFQAFPKKITLALLGTILIMAFSFHVLPVTDFINPGAPASQLFGPQEYFFWWLIIPLIGLFFL